MAIVAAFGLMGAFFMAGLYVAGALGVLSLLLMSLFGGQQLWNVLPSRSWQTYTEWNWVAIPLFILMGELVLRSGIAEKMYSSLSRWVALLPGGLLHTNIASSALFAASAGSSIATAAVVTLLRGAPPRPLHATATTTATETQRGGVVVVGDFHEEIQHGIGHQNLLVACPEARLG